jgi:hypothetical protein
MFPLEISFYSIPFTLILTFSPAKANGSLSSLALNISLITACFLGGKIVIV